MLTSLYYYNHYKPYILKDGKTSSVTKTKTAQASVYSKNSSKPFSYFLNKAVKNEISEFATNLSENLNGIKDSAKYIMQTFRKKNTESNRQDIADGIEDFVESFNSNEDFIDSSETGTLNSYSAILKNSLSENPDATEALSISMNDEGRLVFDKTAFMEKDISEIAKSENLLSSIYDDTCDAMSAPLSKHMNFKSLDYYYNYSYARKDRSSFQLIETGLIVDIAL